MGLVNARLRQGCDLPDAELYLSGHNEGDFRMPATAAAKRLDRREEGVVATQLSLGAGTGGSKHRSREPSNHPPRAIKGDAFLQLAQLKDARLHAPAQPGEGDGVRCRRPCRFPFHSDGFVHPLRRLAFYPQGPSQPAPPERRLTLEAWQ
ncbi:unnamed protein product [Ixodes pacificus]